MGCETKNKVYAGVAKQEDARDLSPRNPQGLCPFDSGRRYYLGEVMGIRRMGVPTKPKRGTVRVDIGDLSYDSPLPPLPEGVRYGDLRFDWETYEDYGGPSVDVHLYYYKPEDDESYSAKVEKYKQALKEYNEWYKKNKDRLDAEDEANRIAAEKKKARDKINEERRLNREYEHTVKYLATLKDRLGKK